MGDFATDAKNAWSELRWRRKALEPVADDIRQILGDRKQLVAMLDDLQEDDTSSDERIQNHLVWSLRHFLNRREELIHRLNDASVATTSAIEASRRLVREYDRLAKTHAPSSPLHASYLQLAHGCRREIDIAKEIGARVSKQQTQLCDLTEEAQAISHFFTELQLHRDRSMPFIPSTTVHREQLAAGASLCLRVIDTLNP